MTKLSKNTQTNLPANPATPTSTVAPTPPTTEVAIRTRDFTFRKGYNDKPVEIFYDGQYVPSFMSCLRAGDFFLMEGKAFGSKEPVCMLCKSAPTVDTRYSQENPTIVMGVTEIAQAPPTVERPLMLEDMTSTKQVRNHAQLLGYDDVEDVDFKE
jgi:hypothetical protein